MLRKNKSAIIILLILVAIAAWFYFSSQNQTLDKRESEFALPDTSMVSRIEIINNGEILTLTQHDGSWIFNTNLLANQTLILILFRVISQVEIKSVVPKELQPHIIQNLTKSGSEVKIFNGTQMAKDYFIWADSANHNIYMSMASSQHPFIVTLPAFEGNFAGLFRTDAKVWRDKTIYHLLPKEISSVKIELPQNYSQSFELNIFNKKVSVKSLSDGKPINFKTEAVESYLFCFRNVKVVEYLPQFDSLKFALKNKNPEKIITIVNNRGNINCLKLFSITLNSGKTDVNRCYGLLNDKEFAILKYVEVDPITRDISFFKR